MATHSPLLGKHASLDTSIAAMRQILQDYAFTLVEQSWQNPVVNVWSVEVRDRDCYLLFATGIGSSKKAALASALGEFIKRLFNHSFWSGYYLGDEIANSKIVHYPNELWFKTNPNNVWPEAVLNDELKDFYNPEGELDPNSLIDIQSSHHNRGICCMPFECSRTGELLNFPINIIENLYAANGLSIGNTIEEAQVQAISEILGCYIKFKVIAEGISLPNIPKAMLQRYSNINESINAIEAAGFPLFIQDASLGGKYPVVAATLLNPQDQGVHISFAAHPTFEIALEHCIHSLFEGKGLEEMHGFAEAGFDMDEIASAQNLAAHFKNSNGIVAWNFFNDKAAYEFVDWATKYTNLETAEEFKQLCKIITNEGFDIYISQHQEMEIKSCRILIPGMSEINPLDDLVWENNNTGIKLRQQILKKDKTAAECEALIEILEALNLDDQYLVSTLIGLAADADSIFNDLSIVEFITLLALRTQDNERVQEGCEWLLHYKKIEPRRLKTYQCINAILQLDGMTNYGTALEKLYPHSILNDALALIDGEEVFPLQSNWNNHRLLIEAYKKVRKKHRKGGGMSFK